MIDELEPKQLVMAAFSGGYPPPFQLGQAFTAEQDCTLRQAFFSGYGCHLLTFDPDFTPPEAAQVIKDFLLFVPAAIFNDRYAFQFVQLKDLVFPVLKGQTLYWGIDTLDGATQACQLIFS